MARTAAYIVACFVLISSHMSASASPAQDADGERAEQVRMDTPSGLPVPRFVSLKSEKTFCRAGPSFAHPVRITFMRKGLPVMVVAETSDHWRKVRDLEGDECWTHRSKLSGVETALVLEDGLALHARPNVAAPTRARLGRGLIARIESQEGGWLRVSAQGVKGWAPLSAFWSGRSSLLVKPLNAASQN